MLVVSGKITVKSIFLTANKEYNNNIYFYCSAVVYKINIKSDNDGFPSKPYNYILKNVQERQKNI